MEQELLYSLVTGAIVGSLAIVFFALKLFIASVNEKFNTLFCKFDDLLERIGKLVDDDDFRELEKRVREIENTMNKCPNCKKSK